MAQTHPFGKWSNMLPHLAQKLEFLRFREPELVRKLNKNTSLLCLISRMQNKQQQNTKQLKCRWCWVLLSPLYLTYYQPTCLFRATSSLSNEQNSANVGNILPMHSQHWTPQWQLELMLVTSITTAAIIQIQTHTSAYSPSLLSVCITLS